MTLIVLNASPFMLITVKVSIAANPHIGLHELNCHFPEEFFQRMVNFIGISFPRAHASDNF